MASEYILELKDIEKSFSTVKVLKGVNLRLKKGQILGLCGENGAGKSTLMNVLGGVYQKNGGTMLIEGEEYSPKTPVDATEAGIAFIHQELNLFLNMTVRQNFMIEKLPKKGPLIDTAKIRRIAEKQLKDMDQNIPVDMLVEDLNIGQRQMVEIAKEIAKDAKIVIQPDTLECEVKWALECITTNKASGGDGIPVELFQILKDDAMKVLHSICQQIWKTQRWPQDWKRSAFIPIPKKGNAKECSNYCTIAFISHASKELLKILQARLLQHSVN